MDGAITRSIESNPMRGLYTGPCNLATSQITISMIHVIIIHTAFASREHFAASFAIDASPRAQTLPELLADVLT